MAEVVPKTEHIRQLIAEHLSKVSTRDDGWAILYQDKRDMSYWELTYPQGEMQGGGPPELTQLSADEAKQLYPIR